MGNLVFQATLGGQVNLVGPNTASTYNINVPAVAGDMVTTGDTGTVTNTMLAGSIANAKLTNSSVTIGSTSVALGATASTVAGLTLTNPTINGFTGDTSVVNIGSGQIYKDTSGNVGIGTSSPGAKLAVLSGSSPNIATLQIGYNGSNNYYDANAHIFRNGSQTEGVRIDSSGNLLVGTTSVGFATTRSASIRPQYGDIIVSHASGDTSGNPYLQFGYAGGGIGTITQNGTTAVAYNTTSDYRLKENVQPLTGALSRIAALKPCTYTWKKAPEETGEGFIAHELQAVVPHAVTGEKDAVDAEGNPVYQGIDTSFLVATLTAAIQEQQALIIQLQADVAALKAPQ